MSEKTTCPRRMGEMGPWKYEEGLDEWSADDTCSFCGSLNPATFMARVEAGDVELGPTDKSYKVYVANRGGERLKGIKFYFQHLDADQRRRFVDLINAKKIHLGMPGHFYVRPFFCVPVAAPDDTGEPAGSEGRETR